ncbi:hypothetical protein NA56DRAFT_713227 [Hyaloscypha hepaticicola]|uniref:Uncharacterized protein n=1 Tax=Hyaloscypha hepaticicola TaxID=2082293 RepID=A0A2J6PEC3_9HELO|nr:hypothetical protein NA56DRAFT_713227 [Hyaloscypha hepaticicola]
MSTPSMPISSPLQSGRIRGFSVQIASGMFYLEPIKLSVIYLANKLDNVQLYEDKCLRPAERRYSLKATFDHDTTTNYIMVVPQERGYENHTYTLMSQHDTTAPLMPVRNLNLPSSSEFDLRHGETKKVQDDDSLFFTTNSLYEFKDSSPNDPSPYNLTSGVVDFPVDPSMSNVFNASPVIQEREPSIENENSHAPPTSQTSFPARERTTLGRHHCPWAGCASKFPAADRDRHFMTIHGKPVKYFRHVAGCSRARGVWRGYSREDKVKEYVKKVHGSGKL